MRLCIAFLLLAIASPAYAQTQSGSMSMVNISDPPPSNSAGATNI